MRWLATVVFVAGCSFSGSGAPDGTTSVDDAAGGDDAPPPADAPIDARRFSVDLCPASYDRTIPGHDGSRYRWLTSFETFATHHADCNDDLPGWTHIVVIDDAVEADGIGEVNTTDYMFVGAVQAPSQGGVDQGWFLFTGAPPTTGWSPVNGGQPDDGGDHFESNEENLAMVASTGNMHDATGSNPHPSACECDGRPIDPTIATYLP